MEYTLTNKYRNIILVTIQCSYTFNVIHFMSGQQLYMFNYQWMTISIGRHMLELFFQLALHVRCYKKLEDREAASLISVPCVLPEESSTRFPKNWHYTTQHNYQLDIRYSNVLCALETLPVLRGCDYMRTCTKGAIAITANTVERDSQERLTSRDTWLSKRASASINVNTAIGNSAIRLA